jgi:predicted membrane channel-forming protein YqfA (hemolysin III family)
MKTKKSRIKFVLMAASSVLLLSGGIIYASDIPVSSTLGCITNERDNGRCTSDGENYFCASKKWYQIGFDCVKASTVDTDKDDGTVANP